MYTYLNTRNEVKEKHLNYKAPLFTTSTIGTHSNKPQRSMNLGLDVMLRNFSSPSIFISSFGVQPPKFYLLLFSVISPQQWECNPKICNFFDVLQHHVMGDTTEATNEKQKCTASTGLVTELWFNQPGRSNCSPHFHQWFKIPSFPHNSSMFTNDALITSHGYEAVSRSSKLGYLNIGPTYLLKWRVPCFKMYRLSSSRKMHTAQVNTPVLV